MKPYGASGDNRPPNHTCGNSSSSTKLIVQGIAAVCLAYFSYYEHSMECTRRLTCLHRTTFGYPSNCREDIRGVDYLEVFCTADPVSVLRELVCVSLGLLEIT